MFSGEKIVSVDTPAGEVFPVALARYLVKSVGRLLPTEGSVEPREMPQDVTGIVVIEDGEAYFPPKV